MSIDYKQLKDFVKEAMFTGGGINEPSAPEGVPHRMPAADTDTPEQNRGDAEANKLYEICLVAREATERLVEALDNPTFDGAYEFAFKASANLRKALNSLEETGAHPMPGQRVVASPAYQQRYNGGHGGGDYAGGGMIGSGFGDGGLEEQEIDNDALEDASEEMASVRASDEDIKALAKQTKLAAAILGSK